MEDVFTEEALKSMDGLTVPLRLGVGGPTIGLAKLVAKDGELLVEATLTGHEHKAAAADLQRKIQGTFDRLSVQS